MKKPAGETAIEKLIDAGWTVSHSATVNRYRYAGTVSPMERRNGREWCRVHHGRCVGKRSWQVTTVLYRAVAAC